MAKKVIDDCKLPKTIWRVETNGISKFTCDELALVKAFNDEEGLYASADEELKTMANVNEFGVAKDQSCGYVVCLADTKMAALHAVLRKIDGILEEEKKRLKKIQVLNTALYNAYDKAFGESLESEHGMKKVRAFLDKEQKKAKSAAKTKASK